jgi:phosphoribosylanthranilate isomerase
MALLEVKICGLTRRSDAELAALHGARYGGAILAPGGKRTVPAQNVATLFQGLPLRRVGVFVDAPLDDILQAGRAGALDVLQLHGEESPARLRELRGEGSWMLWKAIRVRRPSDLAEAVDVYGADADALLLDAWSPDAHGGTGTRFDWDALARERSLIPDTTALVVAGGLTPQNVALAVALLRPDVVDVSSGVEVSPGVKDAAAVAAFIAAALGQPIQGNIGPA